MDGAYDKPEPEFPSNFAVVITLDSCSDTSSSPNRSPKMRKIRGSFRSVPPLDTSFDVFESSGSAGSPLSPPTLLEPEHSKTLSVETGPVLMRDSPRFGAGRHGDLRTVGPLLPYGLGVGRRRLRLHTVVEAIFAAVCPEPILFRRGERIWYDGGGGERRLCLILSGAAEYAPVATSEQPPWINRGDSLSRLQVGTGRHN